MKPTLIDIHSHVNFNAFKEDSDEVLRRALDNNIWVINVGSQIDTSRRAVEIAAKYTQGVYAIVGLHPVHLEAQDIDEEETHFTTRGEEYDHDAYLELAKNSKVVGIGECGLDYFRIPESIDIDAYKQKQREALIQQINLANEVGKPVMFHVRASKEDPDDAYRDLTEVIINHPPNAGGDMHCFGGSLKCAKELLDHGLFLSFTGIVTFKNAESLREIVRFTPLDRLMVETDSPYLAPDPFRGKRCEPAYVEYTARKIAEVKGLGFEEVAAQTTENAFRLFKLESPSNP